jgi:Serine carboxypeptidase S28
MGNAGVLKFCLALAFLSVSVSAHSPSPFRAFGSQGVNLWRLRSMPAEAGLVVQDYSVPRFPSDSDHGFMPQWFNQPLDHFSNASETFAQRFWVNARHYRPNSGGPVYVLDGGETSGANRLPFLDTGIMEILARATGGVSVVLEHRYYGIAFT